MKITRAVVPSLFTILNIFCGFRSLLQTADGDFSLAAWFIILAAMFDVLDGLMARITRSSSDFGVELDSLSDVVSFGVAPAFLVYRSALSTQGGMGMLVSAMPMIFGAIRLARFNAQLVGYDKEYFKGLPIPASAMLIAAYVLAFYQENIGFQSLENSLLMPIVVIVSFLMVSTVKYDTIPHLSRRGIKQHPLRFTVGVIGITWIVVTRGGALFPFLVFYLATGPLRYTVYFIRHALRPAGKVSEEKDAEITSVDV
jgi:CDP-diacylglycerol--serine O-phosphatidyltransferase